MSAGAFEELNLSNRLVLIGISKRFQKKKNGKTTEKSKFSILNSVMFVEPRMALDRPFISSHIKNCRKILLEMLGKKFLLVITVWERTHRAG